ncbi:MULTISPECIES: hypothetical protein [Paraliobacillus]|uniref:hypothetical protein n=1 Tax=Paraliobacillus TaxID=200903 RepID=UPI000DD3DB3C|nr:MULTISPECIES: hypothetical protein [Paraliobacillus]
MVEIITEILRAYGIDLFNVTSVTPRLWKITSNNYNFALKHARLEEANIEQWQELYQLKAVRDLSVISPVYRTTEGSIYCTYQNNIYYLSPWFESENGDHTIDHQQGLFATVGRLHGSTKQGYSIEVQTIEEKIEDEKKKHEEAKSLLLQYIGHFEQMRYMPPFGLEVCTQFRDILNALKQLSKWHDNYLTDIKEEQTTYQSICHGYLSATHHIFTSDQAVLINWEHAHFGDSMLDLQNYLHRACFQHDTNITKIIDDFSYYEKQNPLTNSERSLLAIHLLQPYRYLKVIQDFDQVQAQPFQIRNLLQNYRRLLAGVMFQEMLEHNRNIVIENQTKENSD